MLRCYDHGTYFETYFDRHEDLQEYLARRGIEVESSPDVISPVKEYFVRETKSGYILSIQAVTYSEIKRFIEFWGKNTLRKWYVDDVFIHQDGELYGRGYYIREDGFVEWRVPDPQGRIKVFPISECFHPAGPFSFEPGDPIKIEDGELLGRLAK